MKKYNDYKRKKRNGTINAEHKILKGEGVTYEEVNFDVVGVHKIISPNMIHSI